MSHFGSAITSPNAARGRPAAVLAALVAAAGLVAGCAEQRGQQEANAALASPPPAYCQPRPTPDCEFKNTSPRTVDPVEFGRLKLAYERRCLRHAEKAERERMREMQAAGACEGRPVPSLATSR